MVHKSWMSCQLAILAHWAPSYQVIPSHGNPQMKRTLFDGYLFKNCSVKYQTFHQVSEKTSQQTYSHQKTTWKAFQMPPRAIKHQLTCPIELTSGSFLIGRRGVLVIPRNRLIPSVEKVAFFGRPGRFGLWTCLPLMSHKSEEERRKRGKRWGPVWQVNNNLCCPPFRKLCIYQNYSLFTASKIFFSQFPFHNII